MQWCVGNERQKWNVDVYSSRIKREGNSKLVSFSEDASANRGWQRAAWKIQQHVPKHTAHGPRPICWPNQRDSSH